MPRVRGKVTTAGTGAAVDTQMTIVKLKWDGTKVVALAEETWRNQIAGWERRENHPFAFLDEKDAYYEANLFDVSEERFDYRMAYLQTESHIDAAFYKGGKLYVLKNREYVDIDITNFIANYEQEYADFTPPNGDRITFSLGLAKSVSSLLDTWLPDRSGQYQALIDTVVNPNEEQHLAANFGLSLADTYFRDTCDSIMSGCQHDIALTNFANVGIALGKSAISRTDSYGNSYSEVSYDVETNGATESVKVNYQVSYDNGSVARQYASIDDFNVESSAISDLTLHVWLADTGANLNSQSQFDGGLIEYQLISRDDRTHLVSGYLFLHMPDTQNTGAEIISMTQVDTATDWINSAYDFGWSDTLFFGVNDDSYGPGRGDPMRESADGVSMLNLPVKYADTGETLNLTVRANNLFYASVMALNNHAMYFANNNYNDEKRGIRLTVLTSDNVGVDFSRGVMSDPDKPVYFTGYDPSYGFYNDTYYNKMLGYMFPKSYLYIIFPDKLFEVRLEINIPGD